LEFLFSVQSLPYPTQNPKLDWIIKQQSAGLEGEHAGQQYQAWSKKIQGKNNAISLNDFVVDTDWFETRMSGIQPPLASMSAGLKYFHISIPLLPSEPPLTAHMLMLMWPPVLHSC